MCQQGLVKRHLSVQDLAQMSWKLEMSLFFVFFIKQALVQDLQIAKRSTWDEREKQSSKYQNERKTNLANKVTNTHWLSFIFIILLNVNSNI